MTHEEMEGQRWFTLAEAYDRTCQKLVPHYDLMQEQALRIARLPLDRDLVVIDLGAGSGIFLERVLARHPRAQGYWVDYSEDFLRVARRRLAPYGCRAHYVLSRLEEDLERAIEGPVDLIFSMSAIHHLAGAGKRALFRRCSSLLRAGGWLLIVDEMQTVYPDAYLASMQRWVEHVVASADGVDAELKPHYDLFGAHFENWKRRNILERHTPRKPGDDLHESFLAQMVWLREAGLEQVDLFLKYHLWSLIGGRRPGPA
ncbi:MAG: class I SAM-dependent methyltransferase [Anaerolineae bacterium]|nr:class I SAM-dependent methyltransferase [Anaerolineae bacterium]